MAIYRLANEQLEPLQPKAAGTGLYEAEIEELVWSFPEEITGEPLFLVARQKGVSSDLRPDIIALDKQRRVVVVEVKRDVDRTQLAQTLEYVGWAHTTSLDEIVSLYSKEHTNEDFSEAWQEFGGWEAPETLASPPRMILVCQRLDHRTEAAVAFLLATNVGVDVKQAILHLGGSDELILEVRGVEGPSVASLPATSDAIGQRKSYGVSISDLIDSTFLNKGEKLRWLRPRKNETHWAEVSPDGGLTANGHTYPSPSSAADALGGASFDGWECWQAYRDDDWVSLHELRLAYLAKAEGN